MDLIDKIIEHGQIFSFINKKYYFVCITLQSEFKHFKTLTVEKNWYLDEMWLKRIVENGPMHVKSEGYFPHNNFKWYTF